MASYVKVIEVFYKDHTHQATLSQLLKLPVECGPYNLDHKK